MIFNLEIHSGASHRDHSNLLNPLKEGELDP